MNILQLPAYHVTTIENSAHDYHINAETVTPQRACTHCQHPESVGFGRRVQLVKDLPMHGKRVGIYIDARRYQCRACERTFFEALPEMDERRMMTKRLIAWIGQQSVKRTFTSIAEEIGITEGTVRMVFKDYVSELERTVRFATPRWLGIDEIHLIKPRCVLANIENNTILDMLPNRNKDTVAKYLFQMPRREQVQLVTMDMWAPYRDAVAAVLPKATIVIDKFHVTRLANDAMEKARKGIRAELTLKQKRGLMHDRFVLLKRARDLSDKELLNLDGWTKNYPVLGEAYRLKEAFYGIYELSADKSEALSRYESWSKSIPPEIRVHFADLVRAFTNWQPWILNYFDHRVTNAYTESLNSLIRVMNRLGRGYSFEALRAKILFTEGAHQRRRGRPKFERQDTSVHILSTDLNLVGAAGYVPPSVCEQPFEYGELMNYGVDISTLTRLIEEGLL